MLSHFKNYDFVSFRNGNGNYKMEIIKLDINSQLFICSYFKWSDFFSVTMLKGNSFLCEKKKRFKFKWNTNLLGFKVIAELKCY